MLGMGTFGVLDEAEMLDQLRRGFRVGYQMIDTARFYNNEDIIGRALKTCIREERIKREELFVVTKTWNDSSLDFVKELKKALKGLQL
jgi:diketogulonate reductase-like aldo/keto reductase